MKILRYVLLALLLVIAVVLIGGFLIYNNWTRGPLPQHSGEITLDGLNAPVEIIRDSWGIPHIYASNLYDLFFAQGFTQAQDRWWQMEWFRHVGSGALQELTGKNEDLLGTDIFIRTVGWRRAAEQDLSTYDPEIVGYLQAFADGVNAYILNRSAGALAFEYNILGVTGVKIEIKAWTPVDSLVWGKVMAWDLSGNRSDEIYRANLIKALGEEVADQWLLAWPFGEKPTIIFPEDLPLATANPAPQPDVASTGSVNTHFAGNVSLDTAFVLGKGSDIGSNNWVVSGKLTQSGKPLLANDPHLSIQMPSIWYEIGLHCQPISDACPLDVTGFALSPTPAVIIGHNNHIAWGVTNVGPDTQDLYKLKINPENELQYEWNGEWRDMQVVEETIHFGDDDKPITIKVRLTHFGPVLNDNRIDSETGEIEGFNNEDPMALRWTAIEPSTLLMSVLKINKATNWDEFREALQYWDSPSQNFVYADLKGNIGYQTPGNIPIRTVGETGLVPSNCASDACAWQGFIPFEMLPSVFNPERGFIATANQALVPLEYYDLLKAELGQEANYFISQEWDYGYRGQRIVEMLQTLTPHSIETFQQIHGDNKFMSAEELAPYVADVKFDIEELNEARNWMLDWDYQLHMNSPKAALYAIFWARLVSNVYNDQSDEIGKAGGGNQSQWAVFTLMQDPENVWWDDKTTADTIETRDDIIVRSFTEAYAEAKETLGSDREKWQWGNLHTSTFVSNPLGLSGISIIENIVNRGPVTTSGGTAVNATGWQVSAGYEVTSLPSMRMIIDLEDFSKSVSIHTTGQSGHPFSPHYDNMIDTWRNIEYHPMLWTREQVDSAMLNKLILKPK